MRPISVLSPLLAVLILSGCASDPTGPSLTALPGTGKTFDQFRADDADCRQYADHQVSGKAADAGVRSAAVGTVVGAVAGAAIGGHEGAGVGAGTGLIVGSMAGAGASQSSAYGAQRQYDGAYVQCMYAKGHRVPVSGVVPTSRGPAQPAVQSQPAPYVPPPPPGTPPPPPPGAGGR